MRYIKPLNEKKPKGAPEFHHSDAPDAEGRFKDLGIKDLAAWLIKTRKKDVKKISGSLTQQIVFNRGDDPKYAEKMEKVRKEVYKQLGREDLLDKMDESLQEPLYNSFFLLEFQKWVYKNRAKINRMSKDEKIKYLEDNYIKKYGNKHLGSEDLSGVGSDIYHSMVLDNIIKESVNEGKMPKKYIGNDEIVYLKTKEDSKGAHYNLYYKGHDIDKGGRRFGSEKELEDFASNYILSNQLYRKLRYEDSIPLPESVDMDDLENAKERLSNPHTILDITYDKTRRGDKFVRFDYENKYVPGKMLDSGPHFVNVRYDNNKDLKKISKELGMDLKESVLNEEDTWDDYPAAAKKNAQMAIDWKEKYGRDEVDAGTPVGWARAHQLAKGENLSTDTVKRMSAFNRHRKNSSIKPELKETPWKDRGYVAWLIWGGDEGVDWAIEKSKEIDAMKEAKEFKYIKPLNEFNQVNESLSSYEYDKWVKENGKIKFPKWIKVKSKEIIDGGFMDKVYKSEHNYMSIWLGSFDNKTRSELYAYDDKGKKEFGEMGYKFIQSFWNDITGYGMFFWQGAMYALEVSKHIRDMEANGEAIEPAYYLMKEYFNNFNMETNRSRVFNAAVEKLEKWMEDNQIKTL